MEENTLKNIGMIPLAYMGDCLYEVKVREYIIRQFPNDKVNNLHRRAVSFVKASAQSKAILQMKEEGFLSEIEQDIVRRGRNQAANPPKNADLSAYRYATGLEALIGYLFFKGDIQRMEQIIEKAMNLLKEE